MGNDSTALLTCKELVLVGTIRMAEGSGPSKPEDGYPRGPRSPWGLQLDV